MKYLLIIILLLFISVPLQAQTWSNNSIWDNSGDLVWQSGLSWASINTLSWGTLIHGITLSWTPSPTYGVTYNIYRSPISGQETLYENTVSNTFIDSGMGDGATYCYYVTAFDGSNESSQTSEVCATTP